VTSRIVFEAYGEYGREDTAIAVRTVKTTEMTTTARTTRGQKPRVARRCAALASSTVKQPDSTKVTAAIAVSDSAVSERRGS
jgi:hypothetical protein